MTLTRAIDGPVNDLFVNVADLFTGFIFFSF